MRTFGFLAAVAVIIALGCMPGMDRRGVDHTRHWRERMERRMDTTDLALGGSRLEFATAAPEARGHFASFSGEFYLPNDEAIRGELRLTFDPASAKAGEPDPDAGAAVAERPAKVVTFRSDKIAPSADGGVFLVSGTWTYGDAERRVSFPARLEGEKGSRTLKATMPLRLGDLGVTPATAGWDALTLTLTAKVSK